MLYNLLSPLADDFQIFNLFRYLTFRTGGAIMTSLLICFLIGPRLILWLKARQSGATNIRKYLEEAHAGKAGTPTMGGLMILAAVSISTLLWA
ncbi:MAG TPA: phospho-N-acetylmuramoyl-pentapeptide-transferase, partial [Alphaproteobacteria bacterium]|nr:phospho-N-acetylmuramoyl-pentapeptide-transferase [Alphaproteobacteria bacterium]